MVKPAGSFRGPTRSPSLDSSKRTSPKEREKAVRFSSGQ